MGLSPSPRRFSDRQLIDVGKLPDSAAFFRRRLIVSFNKRILVTGGAGFLGAHLCERLVDLGDDVICVDNFFTSHKANVARLLERPNFELVRHDNDVHRQSCSDGVWNAVV